MPTKRQILSILPRTLLLEISRSFELSGLTAKPKDAILDSLIGKRSIAIEDILKTLKISDLKDICREFSISSGSANKEDIISVLVSDGMDKNKKVQVPEKEPKVTRQPDGKEKDALAYVHEESKVSLRPEIGTQAQFRKKKLPKTYKYDSSLSPSLEWDGKNPSREQGEALIGEILSDLSPNNSIKNPDPSAASDSFVFPSSIVDKAREAAHNLKAMSKPFLDWAGKAERLSFDVPTLPLFVHERLSTKAIVETLKSHKKKESVDAEKISFLDDLFGDPHHSIADQVLKAYEYQDKWVNRMVLGDSLVVMNSLLHYENMGGQVQMIYFDPPYGVKFGSNFQPFVRKRDVRHSDDESMTREPEMVKAYRDTWELGLHSYLTYMRDRLLVARELLKDSGSVFVQISDENLHHVREVMDEVFGAENFCSIIPFTKTTSTATNLLSEEFDYLLWYTKNYETVKYNQIFLPKVLGTYRSYKYLVNPKTLDLLTISKEIRDGSEPIPTGYKIAQLSFAVSQDPGQLEDRYYQYDNVKYDCGSNRHWKTTNPSGLDRLAQAKRLIGLASQLNYVRYLDDFPATPITNLWMDTGSAGFSNSDPKIYAVQTDTAVIARCLLMTTDPGDLVLDPTCVREGTRVWCLPLPSPCAGREEGWGSSPQEFPPLSPRTRGEAKMDAPYTRGDAKAEMENAVLVPIEQIRPGEMVFGHDGLPHRVARTIGKMHSGKMIGFRHDANDTFLWVTSEHRILVRKRPRSLGGKSDWSGIPDVNFERASEMRREQTPPEKIVWSMLRNNFLEVKFRRQHPIGPYIADFYCRDARLVVEIDGKYSHAGSKALHHDAARDALMKSVGLTVLRIPAQSVFENPDGVYQTIENAVIASYLIEDAVWLESLRIRKEDVVFVSPYRIGAHVKEIREEITEEPVYDLEVEDVHSFITEVCAVHNCGSGTSAFVAEQWGRRWITCDVSRVPLALARQRLLTATFPYFELKEEKRGPVGGFVYKRKQNKKGEEVGGIVPHITLESIANDEPPKEEVLVDRPEVDNKIVRITGPFAFEATIPTPVSHEGDGADDSDADIQERGSFIDRMLEVLRQSPVIQLPGNKSLTLKNIRLPAKTLSLSAEALVPAAEIGKTGSIADLADLAEEKSGKRLPLSDKPLAIVFGPESGAVSEKLVWEAAKEASAKNYAHLLVIGFAIQPNARDLIEKAEAAIGIPATYVQMTPDLMMGDLLKNMRSSQIFSVCGLPDIKVKKVKDGKYQVELLGLDIFDPSTMEHQALSGNDVPAWFLDTDYNGLCFHVCQAFFPRTGAWESLKKALKGSYEESVWDHLAGTISEPFDPREQNAIAVKVIDDRGNELIVTKALAEVSK